MEEPIEMNILRKSIQNISLSEALTEEEKEMLHNVVSKNLNSLTQENKTNARLWTQYFKNYAQYKKNLQKIQQEQNVENVTGVPVNSRRGSINSTTSNVGSVSSSKSIFEYIYQPSMAKDILRLRRAASFQKDKYQFNNKNIKTLKTIFDKYDERALSATEAETLIKYVESLDYFAGGRRKVHKTRKAKKTKKAKKTRKH